MSEVLTQEVLDLLKRIDVRVNERLARIELSLERIAGKPPDWRQIEQQSGLPHHQYNPNKA